MNPELAPIARLLFTEARSHGHWLPRSVDPALLHELYELMKFGPTSMNSQSMRLLFVCDAAERERMAACVNPGNVEKVRSAPVVVNLGQDPGFVELLAINFPHKKDAPAYYDGKPDVIAPTAIRNSSLQGGYLILAARLLGLDCGPMSGFNAAAVDAAFWAGRGIHQFSVLPGLRRRKKTQITQLASAVRTSLPHSINWCPSARQLGTAHNVYETHDACKHNPRTKRGQRWIDAQTAATGEALAGIGGV